MFDSTCAPSFQEGIDAVKAGRLSRRAFVSRLVAGGIAAPLATQLLASAGAAWAEEAPAYTPQHAGGGGTLRLLWWQMPTLLNPHLAVGLKDQDGCRLFYEPLATWDAKGELRPILAAELPSRQNGGLSEDGRSVIWRLKQRVVWHDGQPFTADDVVFNWMYAANPTTAAVTTGSYNYVNVEKIDDHTVRVSSEQPMTFWADAFVGAYGMIVPKHLFEGYVGATSRDAPANLKPVGTGPYVFGEFQPGGLLTGARNTHYHMPDRPFFDAVEMKTSGDAASAARAVLQTGEYDCAGNLQVEDAVLKQLEAGGTGAMHFTPGSALEMIMLNRTDPNRDVSGERSSIQTVNPVLSDHAVRQALSLLLNREAVHQYIYGRSGNVATNLILNPPAFVSHGKTRTFDPADAVALLDKAGWVVGADGVRTKGGTRLHLVFQTTVNGPRQKTQLIFKQACHKAGIELELKAVIPSVFMSSDVANPDTFAHFYADLQMSTTGPTRPDPQLWLQMFLSSQVAQKANSWQNRNIMRWRNADFDAAYDAAGRETDAARRAELMIRMNDIVISDVAIIPVVTRPACTALAKNLRAELTAYGSCLWDIANWHKDA